MTKAFHKSETIKPKGLPRPRLSPSHVVKHGGSHECYMAILAVFTPTSFPRLCLQRQRGRSPSHLRGHGEAPACDRAERTHEVVRIFRVIMTAMEVQIHRPPRLIIPTALKEMPGSHTALWNFDHLRRGVKDFPFNFSLFSLNQTILAWQPKANWVLIKPGMEMKRRSVPLFYINVKKKKKKKTLPHKLDWGWIISNT